MSELIIGIDGGATKTTGVVFDAAGKELHEINGEYANFSVDETASLEHIIDVIDSLSNEIAMKDVKAIQLGIAGVSELEDFKKITSPLEEKYDATVFLDSDAEIALYSIKKDQDGCVMMILGGTGSIVLAKNGEKSTLVGGFGHLLGDQGSGYHLAISALQMVIDDYETNESPSHLSQAILKKIDADTHYDMKRFVYNSSKQQIATLSRFIADIALKGDKEAIALFKKEGRYLADQAIRAYNQLHICSDLIIGVRGGFLQNAPYVKETMIQILHDNNIKFTIEDHAVKPVVGAYYLAMANLSKR